MVSFVENVSGVTICHSLVPLLFIVSLQYSILHDYLFRSWFDSTC